MQKIVVFIMVYLWVNKKNIKPTFVIFKSDVGFCIEFIILCDFINACAFAYVSMPLCMCLCLWLLTWYDLPRRITFSKQFRKISQKSSFSKTMGFRETAFLTYFSRTQMMLKHTEAHLKKIVLAYRQLYHITKTIKKNIQLLEWIRAISNCFERK